MDSYTYVSVKSKLQHAPPPLPWATPEYLTFLKIIVQIPPYLGQNAVQMPHTWVHSGDQMPPPRGQFTGTKMTEGRRKCLQLSNKIFISITKTEKHSQRIKLRTKVSCNKKRSHLLRLLHHDHFTANVSSLTLLINILAVAIGQSS